MSEHKPIRVSQKKVIAFRLSRHHLSKRAPSDSFTSVAGDMAGAQAQVLLAAQISIWARLRGARLRDLDSAICKDHTLVKACGMSRTRFLVPSHGLTVNVRGTVWTAAYNFRWVLTRSVSKEAL